MDAKDRLKVQENLIRAAEGVLREMRSDADGGQLDHLGHCAEKIQELTKQKDFPSPRVQEFQRKAKFYQCDAYEHSIGELLNQILHKLRSGDEESKNGLLAKVREQMTLAGRFGADEEFRASVERRLQLIQMTTGEGIDKRAKAEAVRKTELHDTVSRAPGGKERRRAFRYMDPVLLVELDGHKYTAVNWSIRGVLLENFDKPLALGSHLKIGLSCDGIPGGGKNPAIVVRRNSKHHEIALEFPDISTVVLGLMHEMKVLGIHPEPA